MKKIITLFSLVITIASYSQTVYYTTAGKDRLTEKELKKKISQTKSSGKKLYTSYKIRNTIKTKDSIIHKVSLKINEDLLLKSLAPSLVKLKDKKLPKFRLQTLTGETFDSEKLKGKSTMINFWFASCPPCINEMPYLNKIEEKYKNQFNFIAITYEKKEKVNSFLGKHDYNFNHLIDAKTYIKELGLKAYPMNLFLDKNGVVRYIKSAIPTNVKGEEYRTDEAVEEIIEIIEKLK